MIGTYYGMIMADDRRRFLIENDLTVPSPHRRINFSTIPDSQNEAYDSSTRAIFRAEWGVCIYAYALPYRGAAKVLCSQSARTDWMPFDVGVGQLCGEDFKCVSVSPQIVDSHKLAGRQSRDSDINVYDAEKIRPLGHAYNTVHNTKLILDRWLNDSLAEPKRQWPDDPEIVGPSRLKLLTILSHSTPTSVSSKPSSPASLVA